MDAETRRIIAIAEGMAKSQAALGNDGSALAWSTVAGELARLAGAADERQAAIVAWLRAGFDTYPHGTYGRCRELQSYWDSAADDIESGEWRR